MKSHQSSGRRWFRAALLPSDPLFLYYSYPLSPGEGVYPSPFPCLEIPPLSRCRQFWEKVLGDGAKRLPSSGKREPKGGKSEPRQPKGTKSEQKRAKASRRVPRGSQKDPKVSQRGAQGSQRERKGSRKGAQNGGPSRCKNQ